MTLEGIRLFVFREYKKRNLIVCDVEFKLSIFCTSINGLLVRFRIFPHLLYWKKLFYDLYLELEYLEYLNIEIFS